MREWLERHDKLDKMRQRVESSLGDAYSTFALSQPAGAIIPTLAELASMEEVAWPLDSIPLDESIPDGALDAVIARIPTLVEGWQIQLEDSLLDLLRQSSAYAGRDDLTKDVLSYASTLFTCTRCVGVLTYPNIFAHSCFMLRIKLVDGQSIAAGNRLKNTASTRSIRAAQISKDGMGSGTLVQAAFAHTPGHGIVCRIWHPGPLLQFNEAMHHHTVSLLDQLQMDRTTSSATLVSLNPYVEGFCQCFTTSSSGSTPTPPRKIMRWLQAVRFGFYEYIFSNSDS